MLNYDSPRIDSRCNNHVLDLWKAFDTVDHSILLQKLEYYGFRGVSYSLLRSYLSNRTQRVKIGTSFSDPMSISIGVPQGSNLGPVLFLLYINDIVHASNKLKFTLFADDTVLNFSNENPNELNSIVNEELEKVNAWLSSNKLVLNYDKCHWMLHSTKNCNDTDLNFYIGTHSLEMVTSTKYLGVVLDNKLRFNLHIEDVCRKISKTAGMLYRLKFYVPKNILLNLYYSLVYPYLIYCILVWGYAANVHLDKIFILQKRIVRYITNSAYLSHTNCLFLDLEVLKIREVFKFILGIYSYNMNQNQNLVLPSHSYNTRNRLNPISQFQRLTVTQKSIHYTAPKYFCEIPMWIRTSNRISVFKRSFRNYLLDMYLPNTQ